ncbi:MAG: phospholipid scramblase-related protein [Propionicimonas sp.]
MDPKQAVGGGTLFTEPVLLVNQKPNRIGYMLEYSIFNPRGQRLGTVKEQKNRLLLMALQGQARDYWTERLQVVGPKGELLLALSRPPKFKSTMNVAAADGTPIGQIAVKHYGLLKTLRFDLRAGDVPVGAIVADESDHVLAIQDAAGVEVGRVRRTRDGERKEWFSAYSWRNDSDQYVVEIPRPLGEPLRSLAIAAALAVDTTFEDRSRHWWDEG